MSKHECARCGEENVDLVEGENFCFYCQKELMSDRMSGKKHKPKRKHYPSYSDEGDFTGHSFEYGGPSMPEN